MRNLIGVTEKSKNELLRGIADGIKGNKQRLARVKMHPSVMSPYNPEFHSKMSRANLKRVCKALKANSTVRVLDLRYCGLGVEGAGYLAEFVGANRGLTKLDLSIVAQMKISQ